MRFKVSEPEIAGYLGENGAHVITTLFLEEKELFALLAGYPITERTGIGENIWNDVIIKKEKGDE